MRNHARSLRNKNKWYRTKVRYHFALAVAGAAEEDDQGDDNDPGAVIVKEVAKAVVHQKVLRKKVFGGLAPYAIILWQTPPMCEHIFTFSGIWCSTVLWEVMVAICLFVLFVQVQFAFSARCSSP